MGSILGRYGLYHDGWMPERPVARLTKTLKLFRSWNNPLHISECDQGHVYVVVRTVLHEGVANRMQTKMQQTEATTIQMLDMEVCRNTNAELPYYKMQIGKTVTITFWNR
jgi:hypothetical protein